MDTQQKANSLAKFWDKFGVFVSSLCIVHCVLLPVIIIAFPAVTAALGLTEDNTHLLLLIFLIPATLFAVYSGFRVHKQMAPLLWLLSGLVFIFLGIFVVHDLFSHAWEPVFVIIGSILLVRGHILNSHHCKKCEAEHHCVWEHASDDKHSNKKH